MIKFFHSTATCSTVTHIALKEAGFEFTPIEVSWQRKLNVEELEKVSPLGAVPALVVDGKLLTQTPAILEFIADIKPEARLLAKAGTWERVETMSWVAFGSADLQKVYGPLLGGKRMTSSEAAQAELRTYGLSKLEQYVSFIDTSLAGKDFIMGKNITIADFSLFVFLGWTKWVEFKITPYKNVAAYMKRIYDRPAVKQVLEAEGLKDFLPS